jgi:hypothetical protein
MKDLTGTVMVNDNIYSDELHPDREGGWERHVRKEDGHRIKIESIVPSLSSLYF